MDMSPEEIDERLRYAAEARRTLRRATLKLMALGEQLLRDRPPPSHAPVEPDDPISVAWP
jgi:hypothetical protein